MARLLRCKHREGIILLTQHGGATAPTAPATAVDATAMVWTAPRLPHRATSISSVTLGRGDVLVEVEYATVCGSDLHTVSGRRSAPAPLVLGHEQLGRIVAVGDCAVASDGHPLAVGDRVVWSLTVSCGDCDRCRHGLTQKCRTLRKYGHERLTSEWELSGGFASHMHVLAGTTIITIPDELPAEVAAPLTCGTATAVAALDQASQITDIEGSTVLVTGAGLVGLTAIALATDRGARVIAADPDEDRRVLAERFGAVYSVDPLAPEGSPGSFTAILAEAGSPAGVNVVIEASGSAAAVRQAVASLDIGGVAVLVGSVHPVGEVGVDPEAMVRGLHTIRGLHNYTAAHLEEAVAYLLERHSAHPFRELVGAEYPLDDLDEAIAAATAGGAVRVGVRPAGGIAPAPARS